ncbi:class I SAM-dependent methyltransferase [Patescibacteria group bacterium]|nr:class I SAM-dependent methyltransferase [Patescibacteria group bacterium]
MTTSNWQKHTSHNPLQQLLIKNFYRQLFSLIKLKTINSVLDAGCGEGFTLNQFRLNRLGRQLAGIDASTAAVALAKKLHPHFKYAIGNIYHLPYPANSFDLVVCTEVLEHLQTPQQAIREIQRVSKKYCLFSVPHEPWFRLVNFFRGKYLWSWGDHPEHVQHWTKASFIKFIKQAGLKVSTTVSPFPWLIALAQKPTN